MHTDPTFGNWLKQRRKAMDLTQDDLARQVGYSVETIRKIEADKLRPSKLVAERLIDTLGVLPRERGTVLQAARALPGTSHMALVSTMPAQAAGDVGEQRRVSLPAPATLLVGRASDAVAIRTLLLDPWVRLLTLLGPGGIGKTRLGLHVAADLAGHFANGVAFVSLAQIRDPELVATTIAHRLGVPEAAGMSPAACLEDALRTRELLLVLDNFEQVLPAAPLIADLLAVAPGLNVLVTSRAALRISGEREYEVLPLALPDLRSLPPLDQLAHYAALELFVQRAQAIKPGFRLTQSNARALAEICVRLDGLPLAIELAAARSKLFTPQTLLARLQSRLHVLTGGPRDLPARQQTLRDTIAWSYDLLNGDEQHLFMRLAVFAGGCTLEAVEAVCGNEETISSGYSGQPDLSLLDRLQSLLDKSLLRLDELPEAVPRCIMLETTHEFALEQLKAHGELEPMRRRHAGYYLLWAEEAELALTGTEQKAWLERLDADHDNVRAALDWAAAAGEAELGLRLVGAVWRFWHMRSYISEGRKRLEQALAAGTAAPPALRAKALDGLGTLAYVQADYDRATALHTASLALYRDLGDRRGIAFALNNLATQLQYKGAYDQAAEGFDESLALFREMGDTWGIAHALNNLGSIAFFKGDFHRAMRLFEESLTLARQVGDTLEVAIRLHNLGDAATNLRDYERAAGLLEESIVLFREVGNSWGIANTLSILALVAHNQGDMERAEALYTESLALRRELGDKLGLAQCLEGLAMVAARRPEHWRDAGGQARRAVRLLGAAEALRERISAPMPPAKRAEYDVVVADLRASLDNDDFVSSWAEGRALSPAEVLTTSG